MLCRLTPLLIGLSACSEPLGPAQSAPPLSSISFRALSTGDTVYVDQHSVGCFSVSDSRLMFVRTANGVVVSGEVIWSGTFVTSADRRAPVRLRLLTNRELVLLDNLLRLYRHEEHQTRCWSTGQESTRIHATRGLVEQHETDSCIELEFIDDPLGFTTRPRTDIMSLYELTKPALEALRRS